MKRKLFVIILALCCLLVFSGCCFHSEWYAATCETPKTCVKCGETEGEALGHTWVDATCTAPKTCSVCHLTEGEALGHSWVDATTEAPKTCTTCAATEGERIITDERFTTAATKDIQGKWAATLSIPGEMFGLNDFGTLDMEITYELGNDGTMTMGYNTVNLDAFNAALIDYTVELFYAAAEFDGISREEADALVLEEQGMTVRELMEANLAEQDLTAAFEAISINGVYYVEGNQLHTGISWDTQMDASEFTLDGDSLTLAELVEAFSGLTDEALVFTRVTE